MELKEETQNNVILNFKTMNKHHQSVLPVKKNYIIIMQKNLCPQHQNSVFKY